ncbi:MAG: hypothetical protein IJU21_06940 [Bacteroidales bacterium]|nr:hypothetical protein [Bacteroidales bacterium]
MRFSLRSLFLAALLFPLAAHSQIREEYRPLADLLSTKPGRELTEGNIVEVIPTGPELYFRLQEDIMAARKTVHSEFFIFDSTPAGNVIRTAFRLKALDGVEVQYIAEDFTQKAGYIDAMKKCGAKVRHHPFFPLRRRNHQKLLLLDGKVGYTGGFNIDSDNFFEWDDVAVRVRGPVVSRMEMIFADMWGRRGGKPSAHEITEPEPFTGGVAVQSVDEDPLAKDRINLKAYLWIIDNARDYIYARSPYFKPPEELADALSAAAGRGVEVRLVIPEHKDSPANLVVPFERPFYEDMVHAGVHIHMLGEGFDHGKMLVADDYISAIGSVNLDALSLVFNYENNLYFYDEAIALQVKALIEDSLGKSYELTPEHVDAFPAWSRTFKGPLRAIGKLF